MKKNAKPLIGIVVLAITIFLGYQIGIKISEKRTLAEQIKDIPDFTFQNLDGTLFTQNNLQNTPTIFIYFNSGCDYCQSEAAQIEESLSDFKDLQLIFVSIETKETIQKFAQQYKLDNQENIRFLEDREGKFSDIFGVKSVPYTFIYDEKKILLKKFSGATSVKNILKSLSNE